MSTAVPNPHWHKEFFAGAALELWRRAIPIERTEEEVHFLLEALAPPPKAKLLDIPCGNGRVSGPLALMEFEITGIDSCQEFLSEAQKNAKNHEVDISFHNADMRQIDWSAEFDGAYCMGNSFGYFDYASSLQMLSAVGRSLKTAAKFVLDTDMVAESFLVSGAEKEWVRKGDMHMLIENSYDCRASCVTTQYTFLQGANVEQRTAVHWIYTCGQLCQMLAAAGFEIIDLFGSTESEPFELGSPRLLIVAAFDTRTDL